LTLINIIIEQLTIFLKFPQMHATESQDLQCASTRFWPVRILGSEFHDSIICNL